MNAPIFLTHHVPSHQPIFIDQLFLSRQDKHLNTKPSEKSMPMKPYSRYKFRKNTDKGGRLASLPLAGSCMIWHGQAARKVVLQSQHNEAS